MSTGDTRRRDRILRLRAAEPELHGAPGEAVVFRLFLFNGLPNSEAFSYAVDGLDEDFDGDLRAPEAPVAPGETVEVEIEIEIPEDGKPGRHAFQVAAVLSRDDTVGVAQDLAVVVDAPRSTVLPVAVGAAPRSPVLPPMTAAPRSEAWPWVAGVVGVLAIGLLGLLLITQIGSGDSEQAIVQGSATPTATVHASAAPSASVAVTTAPATTGVIESATPTARVTALPTQTAVPGNGAPSVAITSPAEGQVFCPRTSNGQGVYTAAIPLQGNVSDDEDGVVPNEQISWTFSLDGAGPQFLANSASVSLELHVSATGSKTVEVVLEATDSDGLSSEDSIELVVGGPQSTACG